MSSTHHRTGGDPEHRRASGALAVHRHAKKTARAVTLGAAVGFAATFLWGVGETMLGPDAIAGAKRRAFQFYREAGDRLHERRARADR